MANSSSPDAGESAAAAYFDTLDYDRQIVARNEGKIGGSHRNTMSGTRKGLNDYLPAPSQGSAQDRVAKRPEKAQCGMPGDETRRDCGPATSRAGRMRAP
jgi:hypothetical protein